MQLDGHVTTLRTHLAAVAESGDAATHALAERLSVALDASVRLVILEALSDAAAEITREMAPGSVDVRLHGRDAEFVVSLPPPPSSTPPTSSDTTPDAGTAHGDVEDDGATTRTTLRLPDRLKARVEQAAAAEGVSLNTWLVRAVAAAAEPREHRPPQRSTNAGGSFTGWAR